MFFSVVAGVTENNMIKCPKIHFFYNLTKTKMKKKFLSFAVATATLALAVMPSALADDSTGNSSSVSVDTADGTTFTIALSDQAQATTFSGLAAHTTNETAQATITGGDDTITVVDDINVSLPGYHVEARLDSSNWATGGGNVNSVTLAVNTGSTTVPTDEIRLSYDFNTATGVAVSDRTSDLCVATTSGMSGQTVDMSTSAQEIVRVNAADGGCNAKYTHNLHGAQVKATNLYGGETYSITGTVVAYNGQ